MIDGTTLILKLLTFRFLMEMFLAPVPMVYAFHNLFVLQEYVLMLMISTTETNFGFKVSKQGYIYHKTP